MKEMVPALILLALVSRCVAAKPPTGKPHTGEAGSTESVGGSRIGEETALPGDTHGEPGFGEGTPREGSPRAEDLFNQPFQEPSQDNGSRTGYETLTQSEIAVLPECEGELFTHAPVPAESHSHSTSL